MTRRTAVHPELADSRAGSPLFSIWRVGTPERQHATVDAIAATWQSRPWPAEGLLGTHAVHRTTDKLSRLDKKSVR